MPLNFAFAITALAAAEAPLRLRLPAAETGRVQTRQTGLRGVPSAHRIIARFLFHRRLRPVTARSAA